MRRFFVIGALAALTLGAASLTQTQLPSGWTLTHDDSAAATGPMPQGIALSPDHSELAIVESGVPPPALRVLRVPSLETIAVIPLKDAFGSPQWRDNATVAVPAAASGGIFVVSIPSHHVAHERGAAWSTAVTGTGANVATTSDTDNLMVFAAGAKVATGAHPAAIARIGDAYYVANKGESTLTYLHDMTKRTIPVDLHPSALLASADGSKLFVACADADAIDVVDTRDNRVTRRIDVGLERGRGASPNSLALASDGTLYVTLGAENAVAQIRHDKVVARHPTGWYPTGVAVAGSNVYVIDAKGEGSHANPAFDYVKEHTDPHYIGNQLVGSVRRITVASFGAQSTAAVVAHLPKPVATPEATIVHAHGPIKHVIYIIKENRTYDQVLGDLRGANGDPKLAWFGEKVTPNEHAIARRFGIFDDAFTDAQVSANGHNWSTAAFANDYLERFWPPNYGARRKNYDFEDGAVASTPRNGYLWDEAIRRHVSFRDYGEFVTYAPLGVGLVTTSMPGLKGNIDPRYPPFDLLVSDETRVNEWQREFQQYVARGDLPALEIVRLPNDHTAGVRQFLPSPQAYVAQNDHAFGRIVDTVSHSAYWKNTAIFAIEDDAQNGPDHVDDQRTTLYVASAYAAPGLHHAHYSTSSLLHTIELLLGMHPLSIYDAVAPPMYDAFTTKADMRPFTVLAPQTSLTAVNTGHEYGSAASQGIDLRHADTFDETTLNDILAHAARNQTGN